MCCASRGHPHRAAQHVQAGPFVFAERRRAPARQILPVSDTPGKCAIRRAGRRIGHALDPLCLLDMRGSSPQMTCCGHPAGAGERDSYISH
ncbi:hypothetical protein BC834DRAFT_358646 [Gloeopeniophorella convolvens]|nr:hypothetical protein BC834DRAFT_358646 [Gloeopeniophorella convolvens]